MNERLRVDLAPRVRRGAAKLDMVRPEWASSIDIAKLRMAACAECVLGQVFGGYHAGHDELMIASGSWYGFDAPHGSNEEYEALRTLWIEQINQRLNGGQS